MCGIAAAINVEKARVRVQSMLALMQGRGDITDPAGTPAPNVSLGTRRLKILDRENAIQPFWSYDGRYLVVLNGEIYNYRELRREIEKKNVSVKTDTDTEVLAQGLALFGPSFIKLCNGMFAIVAYDTKKKQFIAARDPLGIKPLYYAREEKGICFASEIKPLLAVTEDVQIEELKPGIIYMPQGKVSYKTALSPLKVAKDLIENARLLEQHLRNAIESQLPDDLPCAIKFSGGIDSTLLLHYARQINPNVKAYHVSHSDGRDRQFAMEYAEKTGLDLKVMDYSRQDVLNILETVVTSVETFEPNIIRNAAFSYLLSKKIHDDGIKVALCGEGADELFCGYAEMRTQPRPLETRARFLEDLHKTQLQRVDRCSMQFELETRVPFLDANVIQLAMRLPQQHLVGRYDGSIMEKVILRKLYEFDHTLPDSIRTRSKVVFVDGAGMGDNSQSGPFFEFSKILISDNDFKDGLKRFEQFRPTTKEEVYYLTRLEKHLDLSRLHLLARRPAVNQSSR